MIRPGFHFFHFHSQLSEGIGLKSGFKGLEDPLRRNDRTPRMPDQKGGDPGAGTPLNFQVNLTQVDLDRHETAHPFRQFLNQLFRKGPDGDQPQQPRPDALFPGFIHCRQAAAGRDAIGYNDDFGILHAGSFPSG